MSNVYVCEVVDVAQMSQSDSTPILPTPSTVEYKVIVSAASSGGPAFQLNTRFIEVSADTTCSIVIGQYPGIIGTGSAAVTNRRLQSNDRITLRVPFYPPNTAPGGAPSSAVAYCIYTTANV
jgi:hypothetical protein